MIASGKLPNSCTAVHKRYLLVFANTLCLFYGSFSAAQNQLPASLTSSIAPPVPVFRAGVLSELPITISNTGSVTASAPIKFTLPLPANVDTPYKIVRNNEDWVCLRTDLPSELTCTYKQPLKVGASTTLLLPVVPSPKSLGLKLGAFAIHLQSADGMAALAKADIPEFTPQQAVAAANVPTINDPNYSKPVINPARIPKYTLPLPNPLSPNFRFFPDTKAVANTDLYRMDIDKIQTQILPPGYPPTTVYAYGDCTCKENFSYPAHTIVENSTAEGLNQQKLGKKTKIQFNDVRNATERHLLPVDHSIHGAMDGEPDIRSVVHLHGFKQVLQKDDGYPEAWKSPSGKTGGEYSVTSPTVGHNPAAFDQANNQEASLLWFHDHTLGMTRLNVYSGLAGLYVLRDSHEQSLIKKKVLPATAYEVALLLQDRMFHADGSLAYPDRDPERPTAPKPTMLPEFFGRVMVVNGVTWPYMDVEPRKYRVRLINGSNARFYTLSLSNNSKLQILGTEGGFLPKAVPVQKLTIGPGERYDLVFDFSTAKKDSEILLKNTANSPFPDGDSKAENPVNQLMLFRVTLPKSTTPEATLAGNLRFKPLAVQKPTKVRKVLLAEVEDTDGRVLPMLGIPEKGVLGWMDDITEKVTANSTETWEIYNSTEDAHPVHLHGGHFRLVNRQAMTFNANEDTQALSNIKFSKAAELALPQERTWKDTVIAYPGQVTRINVKFENKGLFVWHCHILEHEDHDMMRPLLVQ